MAGNDSAESRERHALARESADGLRETVTEQEDEDHGDEASRGRSAAATCAPAA